MAGTAVEHLEKKKTGSLQYEIIRISAGEDMTQGGGSKM